jgi:hypothetical protein
MIDPEDLDELCKAITGAILSAAPRQPDPLVFVVTGKEVRALLRARADDADVAAVDAAELEANAAELEALPMPEGGLMPFPQGYALPSAVPALRESARTFRFLADHVPEEEIFRLGGYDLAMLGLYPSAAPLYAPLRSFPGTRPRRNKQ